MKKIASGKPETTPNSACGIRKILLAEIEGTHISDISKDVRIYLLGPLLGLRNNPVYIDLLNDVAKRGTAGLVLATEEMKTEELYITLVQYKGIYLQFVPDEKKTERVCTEAVKMDGDALPFVPRKFLTGGLCLTAVSDKGMSLKWVPPIFLTPSLEYAAVKNNGAALEFVPLERRNQGLCEMAVKQWAWTFQLVPENKKTKKMAIEAIEKCPSMVCHIPNFLRNDEFYSEARKIQHEIDQYLAEPYGLIELCTWCGCAHNGFRGCSIYE